MRNALVRIRDYTLAAFFLLAIVVLLVSHLTGNSEPDTPDKPLPRRELSDILTWPDKPAVQTGECDTPVLPASRQARWSDTSQRESATGLFKPDLTYNCQATDKPHRELSPRPHQPISQVTTGEYPVVTWGCRLKSEEQTDEPRAGQAQDLTLSHPSFRLCWDERHTPSPVLGTGEREKT